MVHRGMAGMLPLAHRRRAGLVVALALVLLATVVVSVADRAGGADPDACQAFAADSHLRARAVTGTGDDVVVIGDSYAAGLGLEQPNTSWPSRLPGRVHVAAFSGSGFSENASGCGHVSYADRAPAAVGSGADLVVVEGGLNDYDQPDEAIIGGFARLMTALDGFPVVVVGPVTAPSRAADVPHVNDLLAGLADRFGVDYVDTTDLQLPYLDDELHPTLAGHRAFGDAVAARIAALS